MMRNAWFPLLCLAIASLASCTQGGSPHPDASATDASVGESFARDAAVVDVLLVGTPPVDAGSVCDKLTCFTACQEQIAVAPMEQPTGFVPVQAQSSVYESWPLGSDMVLAIGPFFAEVRKSSDLSLLGSAPLPATWTLLGSAVAGNTGFVRDGRENLVVLDLTNPAAPRATAWWLSAGSPLGGWRGKLVLDTHSGVSFVDVSNPLAPVESFCLPVGGEAIAGDTFIGERGTPAGTIADIYHLDPTLANLAPWASLEPGPYFFLDGMRVATHGQGSNLVLYDLGGAAPVEMARTKLAYTYHWNLPVGGFFVEEAADQSDVIALDLRGALEPYSVSQDAGNACMYRLEALDANAAFLVSAWLPGARFTPDSLPPFHCPVEDTVNDARAAAALSPDGHTLLLPGYKGWVFRDLDTGIDRISAVGPVGYPDALGWVGDRIVDITQMISVEVQSSSAAILDVANPQSALATVDGLDPYTQWLGVSGGQMIGFSPSARVQSAVSPTLWLLDPNAATAVSKPLGLSADTGYTGYLWNDKLVVLHDAVATVFNLDGSEQVRIALPPSIATAKSRMVSDLGWFAATDAGEILRFDPTLGTFAVRVESCVQCWLLGADAERIYVEALGPDALGPLEPPPSSPWDAFRDYVYLGYAELRAYAVTDGSYPLVGRYPLTEPTMAGWRLLVGSKLALVADGALILAPP